MQIHSLTVGEKEIKKSFKNKIIKYILMKWKENADLLSDSWWKIKK